MLLGEYTSFTLPVLAYLQIGNAFNEFLRQHVVRCLVIDVAHALVPQVGGILLTDGRSRYVYRESYEIKKVEWNRE